LWIPERSFHVLLEQGDDFFRMPFGVVITVLEASRDVLDPERFMMGAFTAADRQKSESSPS
jgi:hypothetical protein